MDKKAQGGIEFLIVMGLALFLFTSFFVAINVNTAEKQGEKERLLMKNLAISVKDEIDLASKTSYGYRRKFFLPKLLLGNQYEIEITENNFIYIQTDSNALSLKVKQVEGQIKKEENIIENEQGTIYLNQEE